ncbi:MAG TPA: pyridoxal-phosphate dependent enzyme [Gaiellaceae bacterium]
MTPLEEAELGGRRVLLKREDTHELGSFKWRGALPTLEAYKRKGAETVITASTGNHGAATAWAAERLGMRVVVFASEGASRTKVEAMERLGAEVRLVGTDFDEAKDTAERFAAEAGVLFVDGLEREQYEGYSTIADEILDQAPEIPAAVVVPVGNGALLGGIGLGVCRRNPEVERIGVVAKAAPCMAFSWEAGEPVSCETSATFADGIAVRVAIPLAVEALGEVATRMVQVSEREIARAVGAYADAGIRTEGAAAAALAAIPQLDDVGDPLVLIVTGRNIDDDLFRRAREEPESFPD